MQQRATGGPQSGEFLNKVKICTVNGELHREIKASKTETATDLHSSPLSKVIM